MRTVADATQRGLQLTRRFSCILQREWTNIANATQDRCEHASSPTDPHSRGDSRSACGGGDYLVGKASFLLRRDEGLPA